MVSSMSLSEVVSSQGRFIAAKTAPGAALPESPTPSRVQHPPLLPPPSLPPGTSAGAAATAARSAPRGSFPRRNPAPQQEPAPATPPRAGGVNSPTPGLPTPPPAGHLLLGGRRGPLLAGAGGRGRVRQCPPLCSRKGVGMRRQRTWDPGAARGLGEAAESVSAGCLIPASDERGLARRRGGGGGEPARGGLWTWGFALLSSRLSRPGSLSPVFKE